MSSTQFILQVAGLEFWASYVLASTQTVLFACGGLGLEQFIFLSTVEPLCVFFFFLSFSP